MDSFMSELECAFSTAVEILNSTKVNLDSEKKLELYGLYKTATQGACNIPKPSVLDRVGRMKWDSWKEKSTYSITESMISYVRLVYDLIHSQNGTNVSAVDNDSSQNLGFFVSRMKNFETERSPELPAVTLKGLTECKFGDVSQISKILDDANEMSANCQDDQGFTLLHWVCDRGRVDILNVLFKRDSKNLPLTLQDADGNTPLHLAAICDHHELAICYVQHATRCSIDINRLFDIKNNDNETVLDIASFSLKQELAKFLTHYPRENNG